MAVAGAWPYLRGILAGRLRPHVFSWVIWSLATLVVFAAQVHEGGGPGAWSIGVSGFLTALTALLAWLKRADLSITRFDWICFVLALAALPLWYLNRDPLWSVVVLTVVDLLGFGPTVRKAWLQPEHEGVSFFAVLSLRYLIAIAALTAYSVTTLLFPVAVIAGSLALVAMVLWRRRVLAAAAA